jgi:hypothetical protein
VSDDRYSGTGCADVANAIGGRILSTQDGAIDRKYYWQNMANEWAIWFGLPRPFP